MQCHPKRSERGERSRRSRLLFALVVAAAVTLGWTPARAADTGSGCTITIFPRKGTHAPSGKLRGPGLVLAGGGAEEAPVAMFPWMRLQLGGSRAGRYGNVVVLRASGSTDYDDFFYRNGNFASVQSVLIPPCASNAQADQAVPIVNGADAVFFAGGDQAHYVAWKGSALMDAVKRVYARGGIVGGGSAGLAIQGAVVYDAVAADRLGNDTHTRDAVAYPLEKRISFTTGLFAWPALRDTITDTHLVVRDRFGRMIAFLARMLDENLLPGARSAYALGIDQASAVVVDSAGIGTLLNGPGGRGAFLVRAEARPHLAAGQPFLYTVSVSHLRSSGERFDLLHKTTSEAWHSVTVNGARRPPYNPDPYGL
jgi:cyanophycinase-like exopeptidase